MPRFPSLDLPPTPWTDDEIEILGRMQALKAADPAVAKVLTEVRMGLILRKSKGAINGRSQRHGWVTPKPRHQTRPRAKTRKSLR